jgi:tetratricopeptide (TPR) repeat protein
VPPPGRAPAQVTVHIEVRVESAGGPATVAKEISTADDTPPNGSRGFIHPLYLMKRRWRIPPPPFGALEAADGAAVLEENAGSLGILLWDVVRDVVLWSNSPRSEVGELFAPAAERMRMTSILTSGVDSRLESALAVLARVVGSPKGAKRERAAMACREIAQWADELGALATAYAFAHAAALCCTGDPRLSYEAGRIARRLARYTTAHAWLGRSALLGRQLRDWDAYARSYSGLGNTFRQRGNYPLARKHHLRCLRIAREHDLRLLEGDACHDLCILALGNSDLTQVLTYARQAWEAFGPESERLPALANDVACEWMEHGFYRQALSVFEAARPRFRHDQKIAVIANICHAAARLGDISRFEAAWDDALACATISAKDYVADSYIECGRAAAWLGRLDDAEAIAYRAYEIALGREEYRSVLAAEELIRSVQEQQAVVQAGEFEEHFAPEEVVTFAGDLVTSLTGSAALAGG